MHLLIEFLMPLTLLASGIAAGVLVWSVMGGVPLLLSLPPSQYVQVHQFWGSRFDGLQPLLVTFTLLADIAMAIVAPSAITRALLLLAAGLAGGVIVVSKLRAAPLKRRVMQLDAERLPEDGGWDVRREWAGWNQLRAFFGVLAQATNVLVVALLL